MATCFLCVFDGMKINCIFQIASVLEIGIQIALTPPRWIPKFFVGAE